MRTYPFRILALIALITVSIICINVLVDPANIHRLLVVEGFNRIKPSISNYELAWKASHIENRKPDIIFLGNSRVEVGINPASLTARQIAAESGMFNASLAGSSIYSARRMLQHAIAAGSPQTVIVGIDYSQFHQARIRGERKMMETLEDFLAVDESGKSQALHAIRRDLQIATNLDTFRASLKTLRNQSDEEEKLGPEGQVINERLKESILEKGLPVEKFTREARRWLDTNLAMRGEDRDIHEGVAILQDMLAMAKMHRIRMILFVNPVHMYVQYSEIAQDGGAGLYSWKQAVAGAVDEANQRWPDSPAVQASDFSIINDITGEPLPTPSSTHFMQWYVDPSHYNDAAGDLVMRALLAGETVTTPAGAQFGSPLTGTTASTLEKMHRRSVDAWKKSAPADYALLMELSGGR